MVARFDRTLVRLPNGDWLASCQEYGVSAVSKSPLESDRELNRMVALTSGLRLCFRAYFAALTTPNGVGPVPGER